MLRILAIIKDKIHCAVTLISNIVSGIINKIHISNNNIGSSNDEPNKTSQVSEPNKNDTDICVEENIVETNNDNTSSNTVDKENVNPKIDDNSNDSRENDTEDINEKIDRYIKELENEIEQHQIAIEKQREHDRKEGDKTRRREAIRNAQNKMYNEEQRRQSFSLDVIDQAKSEIFALRSKYSRLHFAKYKTIIKDLGISDSIKLCRPEVCIYNNIRHAIFNKEILCCNEVNVDDTNPYTIWFYQPTDLVDVYDFCVDASNNVFTSLRVDPLTYINIMQYKPLYKFIGGIKEIMTLIKCGILRCEYLVVDNNNNPVMVA